MCHAFWRISCGVVTVKFDYGCTVLPFVDGNSSSQRTSESWPHATAHIASARGGLVAFASLRYPVPSNKATGYVHCSYLKMSSLNIVDNSSCYQYQALTYQPHLTTSLVWICKRSIGWGKETIWTKKNGDDYECEIALNPERPNYHQPEQRLWWRSSRELQKRLWHTNMLLYETPARSAMLYLVNARVSAARTRPCWRQRMLTTLTKRVACLKMMKCSFLCAFWLYMHVIQPTWQT